MGGEGATAGGFGGARGEEIDFDGLRAIPVGGNLENGWAAEATVGEKHRFGEVCPGGRGHYGEGNATEVSEGGAVGIVPGEWDEPGAKGGEVESELAGDAIAEVGGAEFGKGESAGGHDEGWGMEIAEGGCNLVAVDFFDFYNLAGAEDLNPGFSTIRE